MRPTVAGALVLGAGASWRAAVEARARAAVERRLSPRTAGPGWGSGARLPVAAVGAAAIVGFALGGPGLAAVATVATVLVRVVRARRVLAAAPRRHADALADVVDGVARALRAGVPAPTAIVSAAGDGPPGLAAGLAACTALAARGVSLVDALDQWATTSSVEGADLVAASFAVTVTSGSDPAPALAAVADTLRERRALRREIQALSAQARLSTAVIAAAPIAFAFVAAATDRATARVLFHTPIGVACIAGGLALDVAGWRWMERITRSPS